MNRRRIQILPNIAMILICMVMLFPVFATTVISFKQQSDVARKPPLLFPCDTPSSDFVPSACRFFVEGYERIFAFKENPETWFGYEATGAIVSKYMPNSLIYAVFSSLFITLFAGLAGFSFSRFAFKGRRILQVGILALTGIPLLTNLLALYQTTVMLRKALVPSIERFAAWQQFSDITTKMLIDSLDRVILIAIYTGLLMPFSIWIVKSFFDAIPRDLEEAAVIDGCSPFGALMRIVAPLAAPGLLAAFLLSFVNIWNEFLTNYLLVGSSKQNLRSVMVAVYDLTGNNLINYQVLAAACVLVMMPVIILFLATRKVFFSAMVEGAVKG
ncbi:MAG: carbohydrate ABC transporter permease [Chloroflexota bacterium]|jgi:multiple sugar transport system permease protein|nr:carbohydrate ABC transporter permease [Chloroflexota bacterium]